MLYVISVDAMADASWQPHRSHAYVYSVPGQCAESDPADWTTAGAVQRDGASGHRRQRNRSVQPLRRLLSDHVDSRVRFNTVTTPIYASVLPEPCSARSVLLPPTLVRWHARRVKRQSGPPHGYARRLPLRARWRNPALVRVPLVRMLRLTTTSGIFHPPCVCSCERRQRPASR